jgi:hypothetical protein
MNNSDGKPDKGAGEKHRRPHWSLTTNFVAAIIVIVVSSVIVLVVLKQPLWIELEIAVGILGLAMFLFFTWILYHGVSFRPDETLTVSFSRFDPAIFSYTADPSPLGEFAARGFAEGGPIGLIFGLLFGIVVSVVLAIVLAVLLWLFSNFVLTGITILALPLFYIFKHSVFFVVRHVDECRGHLILSMKYGASYALVRCLTLYVIIYAAHLIHASIKARIG